MIPSKIQRLQNGETFETSEKGNSMVPLIKSGQKHKLAPVKLDEVNPGDIVYCKVQGKLYTHKVFKTDSVKGCLIGNNKGHINGWTKHIYGKVIEIL